MINISNRELTPDEITLLKRGLKFTPTPKHNKRELEVDLQEFQRKLRLLEHFNKSEPSQDISIVRNKSNFVPPKSNDEYLTLVLDSLSKLPGDTKSSSKPKNNITQAEIAALNKLKNDDNIIIKQADKGGAVVVMDKTYYKEKVLELLDNRENYIELERNEDNATMRKIKHLMKEHASELTKKEIDYVQNFTTKTSNFYGLPKIHKSSTIKTAVKDQNSEYVKLPPPADLKMRPIVAGPSSPTQRLSNFLDLILKPLCKHVASYIRDDLEFLAHIPEEVNENTILVSMDVVNLYTSIPHELGLQAIEYWLDNFITTLERPFTKTFILEALLLILKENTFQFNDKHYKQIQGTAMGTKVAPTYATLVMGFLEQNLYTKYEQIYGSEEKEKFMKEFKRFLDDCFIFWQRSEKQLLEFFTLLNTLHPKIQFTMESHT